MSLNKLHQYFSFNRSQRNGLILLFSIIVILQLIYFFTDFSPTPRKYNEEKEWLALQPKIDSLKTDKPEYKLYAFNPNFITDYKGYRLGMSVVEIDRLLAYRKEGKYVNTAAEFQSVTGVSDSLLETMKPYFKFPEWTTKGKSAYTYTPKKEVIKIKDINLATKEDLIMVYGIGETLSERILKLREKLGGFVSMEQMNDVWGLSEEVILNLKKHFIVETQAKLRKIDINNASTKELSQFPYFNYNLAREIVTYRSMYGDIKSNSDLKKIKGFPVEKAEMISTYLIMN